MTKRKTKWERNELQFPRLLAEIRAVGLSSKQYAGLIESMDLTSSEIDDLLERAEYEWCVIKYGVRKAKKMLTEVI